MFLVRIETRYIFVQSCIFLFFFVFCPETRLTRVSDIKRPGTEFQVSVSYPVSTLLPKIGPGQGNQFGSGDKLDPVKIPSKLLIH